MNERFLNQRRLIDEQKLADTKFIVVGCGAIGSAFILGLSKMGARNITAYDYDTLEDHNFANQLHPVSQLGKPKVFSLESVAAEYGDCRLTPINAAWTPGNAVDGDVIVSCVDNMDVRAALWNHYKTRTSFFIDGRMGAFVFKTYGVDISSGTQSGFYADTLHTQAQAARERCGEKSIIYTVYLVAGMMLSQVREWLTPEARPYRATEVIYDALNHTISRVNHNPKVEMNVIEEEDESGSREHTPKGEEIVAKAS